MGQCLQSLHCSNSSERPPFSSQIALKFPNTINGIRYHDSSWVPVNINQWISNLYKSSNCTHWIVYNDDTSSFGNNTKKKGHCKGIISWKEINKDQILISWLIHSVPNYPREFNANFISELEPGELIYGQSFYYMEKLMSIESCQELISHILKMEPNIYISNFHTGKEKKCDPFIYSLPITDSVTHILKPPNHEIDIYYHIADLVPTSWYIETWIRGKAIMTPHKNINEIQLLFYGEIEFYESQDHSKWAVSEEHIWIGDLNRMTSQFHRGGGGVLIHDKNIAKAFRSLIKTVSQLKSFT